jgi:hypothetical protein
VEKLGRETSAYDGLFARRKVFDGTVKTWKSDARTLDEERDELSEKLSRWYPFC